MKNKDKKKKAVESKNKLIKYLKREATFNNF